MPFPVELYTSQLWVIIKNTFKRLRRRRCALRANLNKRSKKSPSRKSHSDITIPTGTCNWNIPHGHWQVWRLSALFALTCSEANARILHRSSQTENYLKPDIITYPRYTRSETDCGEDYQSLFPLSLPSLKFYTMQYSRPTVLKINIDIDGSSNLYSLGYTHGIHSVTRPHE